ncbi:hypothetical protein HPB47_011926 [Ixodes persulcatus]|uniref:Uncharacterized protein n=1 Tax=Ixodes persulcatus TaxID=34615 RepID=A0AC60NUW8_IXOPE|nr:hypothetical protein HPB47_011926 [Ixodes persulcatus]
MTSDIESSNGPMSIDMDEAQASTSTIIKDGYEIPPIHYTAGTMTTSSSTIVSTNDELHSDDGDYEVVHGEKRRKTNQSSASGSKEKTNLQVGFTVLYMPTDTSKVASLSKFKLTDYLNNVAPDMISVVRINKDRNIVAVDVKKPALKAELLKLTKLCALPVRAFLPSDRTNCYGVLRDIDPDCTETDIKTRLQSTACITEVKRLGKTSPVVRVSFATKVAPQHVNVGLVRTEVIPYRARPLQCYRCHKFGHIAAACAEETQLCSRCGQCHEDKCEANPCCVNCHGNHASNAPECPVRAREAEVARYKLEHNTTFCEAKSAVHAKRQANKTMDSNNIPEPSASTNNTLPLTAHDFPPLEDVESTPANLVTAKSTATTTLPVSRKPSFWDKPHIKNITSHKASNVHMRDPTRKAEQRLTLCLKP